MSDIQVMSPHLADLIAAGEVVERPASVVKELCENAIDAGARKLTVEIQRGGLSFIRVTDDGCGIAAGQLKTAFLRHATSKLHAPRDLEAIGTLGFRGEALAAIASVSRVSVLTRTADSPMGSSLTLEGGQPGQVEEAGCPLGTTMVVRDLFYNTPARLKFMKKDSAEGAAVNAVVQRVALSHPEVSLRFLRDGKQELLSPGDGKLQSAVYAVLGRDLILGSRSVQAEGEDIQVSGFASLPVCCRGSRSMQFFFVNGRPVKSSLLTAALEEAYRNQKMVGRFPACVLHLQVRPNAVDVNVHPAKTEVRFTSEQKIFTMVCHAVQGALEGRGHPSLQMSQPPAEQMESPPAGTSVSGTSAPGGPASPAGAGSGTAPSAPPAPLSAAPPGASPPSRGDVPPAAGSPGASSLSGRGRGAPGPGRPGVAAAAAPAGTLSRESSSFSLSQDLSALDFPLEEVEAAFSPAPSPPSSSAAPPPVPEASPPAAKGPEEPQPPGPPRGAGSQDAGAGSQTGAEPQAGAGPQAGQQAEARSEGEARQMELPSQSQLPPFRVAGELFHTYILVEQGDTAYLIDKHAAHEAMIFRRLKAEDRRPMGQRLLTPVVCRLGPREQEALLSRRQLLEEYAFEVDELEGSLAVRQAPSDLDTGQIPGVLEDLARRLLTCGQADPAAARDELLHSLACRAAIKGGWHSAPEELEEIARAVLSGQVRCCPHGRPVAVQLTRQDLERQLGRSGS